MKAAPLPDYGTIVFDVLSHCWLAAAGGWLSLRAVRDISLLAGTL